MNFVISSASLLKQLQRISGVLSTNNTLPILDNFLFEIISGKLTISASDLETTMRTSLEVEAKEEGKIAIPAKLLLDVLKNLPDQPCTFLVNNNTFSVEIAYDNGKSKMVGYNGEDFPRTPELSKPSSINISGEIISNAINKTLFATGIDELRPVMSGVFCEFSPDNITFVATDAHKLVHHTRTDSQASGSSSFILPKKPLNLLKLNLKGDEDVKLEYNDCEVEYSIDNKAQLGYYCDGNIYVPNNKILLRYSESGIVTQDYIFFNDFY